MNSGFGITRLIVRKKYYYVLFDGFIKKNSSNRCWRSIVGRFPSRKKVFESKVFHFFKISDANVKPLGK